MKKMTEKTELILLCCFLLCFGFFLKWIDNAYQVKQKTNREYERVFLDAVSAGQFDEALSLVEKLPKKAQDCNRAYILYAQDFNNWSGTGEELFLKVREVYQDEIFSNGNLLFGTLRNENETIHEDDLENAFVLWDEAYKIREHFFQGYVLICLENMILYQRPAENGVVTFTWAELAALDDQMSELYYSDMEKLNQIKSKVQFTDTDDDFLRQETLEKYYNRYLAFMSVAQNYSKVNALGWTEFTITEEDADYNYAIYNDRFSSLSEPLGGSVAAGEDAENAFEQTFDIIAWAGKTSADKDYIRKLFEDYCPPIRNTLLWLACRFPSARPNIIDPYLTDEEFIQYALDSTLEIPVIDSSEDPDPYSEYKAVEETLQELIRSILDMPMEDIYSQAVYRD